MLTVHVDIRGLVPWKANLDAATRRAAQMAGSSAIKAMRAEGSRQIRSRKAMKVAAIGKAVTVIYPTSKATLLWRVKASGNIVPVSAFPHRQTKKGVAVEINKGSRKVIRSAFLATMKSGHKGVFRRTGKNRLPIKEAFTTKVSDAFRDAIPAVTARGSEVFASTFARVLPLEAAKRKGAR